MEIRTYFHILTLILLLFIVPNCETDDVEPGDIVYPLLYVELEYKAYSGLRQFTTEIETFKNRILWSTNSDNIDSVMNCCYLPMIDKWLDKRRTGQYCEEEEVRHIE